MSVLSRSESISATTNGSGFAERPEVEMSASRPAFLMKRSRNAKGTLVGGAALAGAVVLGAAALATALIAKGRRVRSNRLRGKVVLITGSSRGLGLAMAEEFARHGARIVLNARDHAELERARLMLLDQKAVEDPRYLLVVPADLRKPEEAEYLVHRVTEEWGQIDILVNNAGVITVGPVENLSTQDFYDVMQTNFFSGVHCTVAALPQMLSRASGTIVNITSIGGKVAVPHLLPYTASKFASVGFSEGLHAELHGKGIHVLTVCPGLMRTGSHLNALFSGDAEREYRWFSLGASTPGASTSAGSAARRIVRAVISKQTEIAITPQAVLAARLGNVSPALTAQVMGLMNRLLPLATEELYHAERGLDVRGKEPGTASSFGWRAAQRYNEIDGSASAG
jgi:short-subunit dehydrogenase